ncbi:MAG: bifunctional phosphoribosyl-AMP cyclohydrolase/phosphoribosyl-ATP diphosphatase HisIE [Clostridiales bacterium]|jgi:phosphoribosyl-ATP pyrophosphohydrolase/phosphoribosyl-AMP cyclohydrolase|nr:bifunctional phosphoribosyl-AMP cyclohydrolase/phosphoribosyl-ATP diphosphatase HisIE [Clostridiales bacterium]
MCNLNVSELKFDERGLLPAITQDAATLRVLMLAYMNREALERTLSGGKMCYFSRSRKQLWLKGETSGHFQYVETAYYDCDADALLFLVRQEGAACHTGEFSCFHRPSGAYEPPFDILDGLYKIITDRRDNPVSGSYTNYLFAKGLDKILKKVGEEAAEVIIAGKNLDKAEITAETADLIYHLNAALVAAGVRWDDVRAELSRRHEKK